MSSSLPRDRSGARTSSRGDDAEMRRVVWLLNDFDRGGAQQGLLTLAQHGAFEGVALTVTPIIRGSGALIEDLERLGVPVVAMHEAKRMKVVHLLSGAWRLWLLLGEQRPSALILSLPQANIIGRLIGRLRGVPAIASFEHNTHLARPVYESIFRLTSSLVDWTLADCDATADEATQRLYTRPAARRTVLPLVSFLNEPTPPIPVPERTPGSPFLIVNAGRFTAVKNQAALIHAVRQLLDCGQDVTLRLYGDGKERRNCETLASALALEGHVQFMGHGDRWWTKQADLFGLPSRHECL